MHASSAKGSGVKDVYTMWKTETVEINQDCLSPHPESEVLSDHW